MDLRGKHITLERLTNKLVKQAIVNDVKVIIIDPIYKVLAGDENSSEDVSKFCVALEYLVEKLGVSVVYCHHHSKGAAGYTSAMMRASGSGVFSRDADTIASLDPLEVDEEARQERFESLGRNLCAKCLDDCGPSSWRDDFKADAVSFTAFRAHCRELLPNNVMNDLIDRLDVLEKLCQNAQTYGAWRIDLTVREYATPSPIDVWFQWPLHVIDEKLKNVKPMGHKYRETDGRKTRSKKSKEETVSAYNLIFADKGKVTVRDMVEALNLTRNAVRDRIDKSDLFVRDKDGNISVKGGA
jgi:RecA-family ATPase